MKIGNNNEDWYIIYILMITVITVITAKMIVMLINKDSNK